MSAAPIEPVRVLTITIDMDVNGNLTWHAEGLALDLSASLSGSYCAGVVYDTVTRLGNGAQAWAGREGRSA